MRADRLIALLMLLQRRGQMTAQALADELETSVRTVYRDIDALSAAGIPIYAERGRGGGCALLDSFQTNLTGLTENEVRALFMLSIPGPLATLGVAEELKSAMLKLSAALPAARRQDEDRVRQRIHLDSSWWFQAHEPVPHLDVIQRAVWQDHKLRLTYCRPYPIQDQVELLVEPYGLVAKAGVWYLVALNQARFRAYRVTRLLGAELVPESFERCPDFDLAAFWQAWSAEFEENRANYPVTVRAAPDLIALLPLYFGEAVRAQIVQAGPPDAGGWLILTLPFDRLEPARDRILGFGRAIEVLAPEALRLSVIDYAQQIVAFYHERGEHGG
ncbi:MAG: YafY family transcriptional regulator [Chloroflexi bacterium]|nr:YafY family transcriptional regulator [Chloroflexota bacterium]